MKASTGGFLHLLLWHLRVGGREIGKGGKGKTFQGGPMASLRATKDVAALSSRSPLTIGPFSRLKRPLLYIAPPWQRGRRLAALDGGDEPRGIEVPMICVRNQPRSQFGADNDVEAAINFWETGKLGKSGERADREGERVFLRPFGKLWVLEKKATTAACCRIAPWPQPPLPPMILSTTPI